MDILFVIPGKKHVICCLDTSMNDLINRRKTQGICVRCGVNDPVPGFSKCAYCFETHAEKAKELYHERKRLKLCTRCEEPVKPGKTKCEIHLKRDRERK